MLEDVRKVCSLSQALEKSAGLLARAMMLRQRRNGFGESLVEARNVRRADLLEGAELDVAGDDRSETPIVGASKGADPRNLQLVRVDLWLGGGAHLVGDSGHPKRATHGPLRALDLARF